jgi:hypothetical protein
MANPLPIANAGRSFCLQDRRVNVLGRLPSPGRLAIFVMTFTVKVNTFMGRPPGRLQDRPFQMRVSDGFLKNVDRWRGKQPDKPSRAAAIRRLVELALSHATPRGHLSDKSRGEASTQASKTIDRLRDKTASPEEQENRKRKLIKGPLEFRDIRHDQSGGKPKTRLNRKASRS